MLQDQAVQIPAGERSDSCLRVAKVMAVQIVEVVQHTGTGSNLCVLWTGRIEVLGRARRN